MPDKGLRTYDISPCHEGHHCSASLKEAKHGDWVDVDQAVGLRRERDQFRQQLADTQAKLEAAEREVNRYSRSCIDIFNDFTWVEVSRVCPPSVQMAWKDGQALTQEGVDNV
jgi:hypothetical protein